tara:strand:+ start:1599 stop:1988 length:390 start_codon:yes stop_codon:yes gene_type:complete
MTAILTAGSSPDQDDLDQLMVIHDNWHTRRGPLASKKYIAQLIERMAQLFQCNVPDHQGLEMYFAVLSDYPEALLRQAAKTVATTHKWPRLPFPADFIAVIEDEAARTHHLIQAAALTHSILTKRRKNS